MVWGGGGLELPEWRRESRLYFLWTELRTALEVGDHWCLRRPPLFKDGLSRDGLDDLLHPFVKPSVLLTRMNTL